jgi:hypothetical protein
MEIEVEGIHPSLLPELEANFAIPRISLCATHFL